MADNMLPPEYQDQLDQINRKRMLAQLLQQRAMNYQGPQQGAVASRISPFSALGTAAMGALGGYFDQEGMSGANKVKQGYETDQLNELKRLQGLPEDQRLNESQTSKFPSARELAKTLQAQMEKRRELQSGVYKEVGDVPNALNVLNGQPTGPARQPAQGKIDWINPPGGGPAIPKITNFDKYGNEKIDLGPRGTDVKVTTTLPGKEGEYALKNEQERLAELQGQAKTAMETLATASRLNDALEQGAQTGGGAGAKQIARKMFQAVGVSLPETGPTDTAKQEFGKAILSQISKLGRQPTDEDARRIAEIVGTIDTDPTASAQIIAIMNAQSHKTLQDFQDFVATKRQGQGAKAYPGLYDTADIGIRQPTELTGSPNLQMGTMKELKRYGADITRFKDPSGKPFPQDADFSGIRQQAITPPTPAAVQPEKPVGAGFQKFEENKIYQDANGNKAKFVNGQWVPL